MKVLVTGAAGLLGKCVCERLAAEGIEFRAIDRVGNNDASFPIDIVDLLEKDDLSSLLEGMDVLAHFANHTNWDGESPLEVYNENTRMNMNIFQAAANAGCKRIVFSSSVQVLDGQLPVKDRSQHPKFLPYIPIDSDMPAIPRNTYALSKQAAENALAYFSATEGLTCVAFRFPLLIDGRTLATAVKNGGMYRGNCYDGFTYLPVDSGAEVVVKAMKAKIQGYRCYFVAAKDNLEQRPAQEIIEEELSHLPCSRPIKNMDTLVDCAKVEAELGWEQPRSLTESYHKYYGNEFEKHQNT